MKPRTRIQKAVAEQSARLPQLTAWQRAYAIRNCFDHYAVKRRNRHICSNCGEECGNGGKCPNCGMPLTAIETRKRTARYVRYFGVVTTIADFQVVRYFICNAQYRVGQKADYRIEEVLQKWIAPDGRLTVMARPRSYGWYVDQWDYSKDLTIRADVDNPVFIINAIIVARPRVTSQVKRNGFDGRHYYGLAPETLFEAIIKEPKCETLLKAGQYSLLRLCAERPLNLRHWDSMKICIRNQYNVKDAKQWIDMVNLLENCGKDIRNPHYLCPVDLAYAHDHWLNKHRELERKARIKCQREKAAGEEEAFRKMKSKYFGIEVTDGTIVIKVLDSVMAHVDEGAAMHHCVSQCGYAMKPNSLILSATLNGERLETIEIDLANLKIAQCRGLQNQTTPYHAQILELMTKNLPLIAKRKSA